jgi:hypothetical protein
MKLAPSSFWELARELKQGSLSNIASLAEAIDGKSQRLTIVHDPATQ